MSITQSLTPAEVIANEANLIINGLGATSSSIDMAESALESLQAVAEQLAPDIARQLKLRLVALRNRIHVLQVRSA
ncbi:hypothetical protein [Shewanella sp.]|uniref:hypothetical protein n=1 Tax=Shewanella sp. TaxID=50422 RepID=UPI003A96D5AE